MSLDIELPTDQSIGPAIEDSIMMNPSPDVTDDPPTTVLSQSPDLQADLRSVFTPLYFYKADFQ